MIAGGVGMVGSSFIFKERADDAYAAYLVATDPARIEDLYDQTVLEDRLSRVALLGGEAMIATGLYLRFIRPPATSRVSFGVGPRGYAICLRF